MPYLVSKYAKSDSLYPKDLVTRAKIDQRLHFDTSIIFGAMGTFVVREEDINTLISDKTCDLYIFPIRKTYSTEERPKFNRNR